MKQAGVGNCNCLQNCEEIVFRSQANFIPLDPGNYKDQMCPKQACKCATGTSEICTCSHYFVGKECFARNGKFLVRCFQPQNSTIQIENNINEMVSEKIR